MKNLLLIVFILVIFSGCKEDESLSISVKPWFDSPQLEWGDDLTDKVNGILVNDISYLPGDSIDVTITRISRDSLELSFRDSYVHPRVSSNRNRSLR